MYTRVNTYNINRLSLLFSATFFCLLCRASHEVCCRWRIARKILDFESCHAQKKENLSINFIFRPKNRICKFQKHSQRDTFTTFHTKSVQSHVSACILHVFFVR